jgi:hypothetical protein
MLFPAKRKCNSRSLRKLGESLMSVLRLKCRCWRLTPQRTSGGELKIDCLGYSLVCELFHDLPAAVACIFPQFGELHFWGKWDGAEGAEDEGAGTAAATAPEETKPGGRVDDKKKEEDTGQGEEVQLVSFLLGQEEYGIPLPKYKRSTGCRRSRRRRRRRSMTGVTTPLIHS